MGHRRKKAEYGYREYRRKVQVGEVLFGAVMILVQLGARQFTDSQAVKNVLTVMAILSVLPTANVASPLLAAWRYKTPPRSFLERAEKEGRLVNVSDDLPRSFVLCARREGPPVVYLCQLSAATLLRRAENNSF